MIYNRIQQGQVRDLPELTPDLVYTAVLPYLGPEGARDAAGVLSPATARTAAGNSLTPARSPQSRLQSQVNKRNNQVSQTAASEPSMFGNVRSSDRSGVRRPHNFPPGATG